mmetsp:Transcript_7400/g.14646  ORF Transcript_7400/g.14646 Transcript_7400/m.14646 type:complete len:282 (-) Transcript_7400:939-1784(-)
MSATRGAPTSIISDPRFAENFVGSSDSDSLGASPESSRDSSETLGRFASTSSSSCSSSLSGLTCGTGSSSTSLPCPASSLSLFSLSFSNLFSSSLAFLSLSLSSLFVSMALASSQTLSRCSDRIASILSCGKPPIQDLSYASEMSSSAVIMVEGGLGSEDAILWETTQRLLRRTEYTPIMSVHFISSGTQLFMIASPTLSNTFLPSCRKQSHTLRLLASGRLLMKMHRYHVQVRGSRRGTSSPFFGATPIFTRWACRLGSFHFRQLSSTRWSARLPTMCLV